MNEKLYKIIISIVLVTMIGNNIVYAKPPLPLPNLGNTCHSNATWQILLYAAGKLQKQLNQCYLLLPEKWDTVIKNLDAPQQKIMIALAQLAGLMYYGNQQSPIVCTLDKKIKDSYKQNYVQWDLESAKKRNFIQTSIKNSGGQNLNLNELRNLIVVLHAMIGSLPSCTRGIQADPEKDIKNVFHNALLEFNCFSETPKNLFSFETTNQVKRNTNASNRFSTASSYFKYGDVNNKKLLPFAGTFNRVGSLQYDNQGGFIVNYNTKLPEYALIRIDNNKDFNTIPQTDTAVSFEQGALKIKSSSNYNLIGVILHQGGHWNGKKYDVIGGHYTAYVHDPDTPNTINNNGDWYHCDDHKIAKVNNEELKNLLKQGFRGQGNTWPVYLLYQSSDTPAAEITTPSSGYTATIKWKEWQKAVQSQK